MLLLSETTTAQHDLSYHQNVNAFANSLIARHIDTLCVYEKYDEKKNPPLTQYIFWKENNQSYANKFDQTSSYPTVEIKCDGFWKTLFDNIVMIKNETVEPFGYIAKTNGKDVTYTTSNAATEVRQFKVFANGDITPGWYNSFDFLEEGIIKNEMRKNIYFERNTNLKGRQITNKLNDIIIEIEKK